MKNEEGKYGKERRKVGRRVDKEKEGSEGKEMH